jgi:hypothetical protein
MPLRELFPATAFPFPADAGPGRIADTPQKIEWRAPVTIGV